MCIRNWQKLITRAPLIVQLVNYIVKDGDKMINLNVLFLSLNNIFEMLFSIYIPTMTADETRLNMLIASMGGLFQLAIAPRISTSKCYKIAGKIRLLVPESETSFNPE